MLYHLTKSRLETLGKDRMEASDWPVRDHMTKILSFYWLTQSRLETLNAFQRLVRMHSLLSELGVKLLKQIIIYHSAILSLEE